MDNVQDLNNCKVDQSRILVEVFQCFRVMNCLHLQDQ
jgi:hypothetical protein